MTDSRLDWYAADTKSTSPSNCSPIYVGKILFKKRLIISSRIVREQRSAQFHASQGIP